MEKENVCIANDVAWLRACESAIHRYVAAWGGQTNAQLGRDDLIGQERVS